MTTLATSLVGIFTRNKPYYISDVDFTILFLLFAHFFVDDLIDDVLSIMVLSFVRLRKNSGSCALDLDPKANIHADALSSAGFNERKLMLSARQRILPQKLQSSYIFYASIDYFSN